MVIKKVLEAARRMVFTVKCITIFCRDGYSTSSNYKDTIFVYTKLLQWLTSILFPLMFSKLEYNCFLENIRKKFFKFEECRCIPLTDIFGFAGYATMDLPCELYNIELNL